MQLSVQIYCSKYCFEVNKKINVMGWRRTVVYRTRAC